MAPFRQSYAAIDPDSRLYSISICRDVNFSVSFEGIGQAAFRKRRLCTFVFLRQQAK